jgi:cytochrome c553
MPSEDYTYMSEADVAAIVSYVRSRGAVGAETPPPRFGARDRLAILKGELEPTAMRVQEGGASLDLGPRYDGGRYIARTMCAGCHGLDLSGTPDARVPNLNAVNRYALRDFFALLRQGHAPDDRPTPVMKALARPRFSEFKDYEVMALYDYLAARAAALPPR